MRCVRFEEQGRARIGFIDGDVIRAVYGSIDTYWRMTDEVFPLAGAKLLLTLRKKHIECCYNSLSCCIRLDDIIHVASSRCRYGT